MAQLEFLCVYKAGEWVSGAVVCYVAYRRRAATLALCAAAASGDPTHARAHYTLHSAHLSGLYSLIYQETHFTAFLVSVKTVYFVVTMSAASYRPSSFSLWSLWSCPLCVSASMSDARVPDACARLVPVLVAAHLHALATQTDKWGKGLSCEVERMWKIWKSCCRLNLAAP